MSKKPKKSDVTEQRQPTDRNSPPDLCAYPAVAAYLSRNMRTSEEEAQNIANVLASFAEPAQGKLQFDRCESAAERLFLLGGMLKNEAGVRIRFADQQSVDDFAKCGEWPVGTLTSEEHDETFALLQQQIIGEYRVDFYLPEIRMVVEVDGFEFHGTKEQFIADKKRDRALLVDGYRVVRFSGSEIYSDPAIALCELFELAVAASPDDNDAMGAHQRSWSAGAEAGYQRCLREFEVPAAPEPPQLPAALAEAAE